MVKWSLICSVGAAWIVMITLGLIPLSFSLQHICDDDVDWTHLYFIQKIPIGEIFGGYIFCFLAELFGRKHAVNALLLPIIISCALLEFSCNIKSFIAATYIRAISFGGAFTILPIYLGELSEKRSRGTVISILFTSEIIAVYVSYGIFIMSSISTTASILNYTSAILSIITSFVFSAIAADTPGYLIQRKNIDMAKETLKKIRNPYIDIDQELKENINETVMLSSRSNGYLKPFLLSLILLLFGVVTGDYSIQFYKLSSSSIVGYEKYVHFILGVAVCGSSLVCPLLVDRIGRLSCLMISFTLMFISQLILIILIALYKDAQINDFYVLIVLSIFYLGLWMGAKPIPFVILGELFPMKFKMIISATMTGIFFTSRFMMLMYIKYDVLGANVLLYSSLVFCLIAIGTVKLFYFETNGKSLNEIQSTLTNE